MLIGRLARVLALALLALAALWLVAAGCSRDDEKEPAVRHRVYVRDPLSGKLRFEPRAIHFKDAGFTRLRWSGWGGRTTQAQGRAIVLSCKPSCAEGKRHRGRVRLALTRIRSERGQRVYQCIEGQVSNVPPDVRRVHYCAR